MGDETTSTAIMRPAINLEQITRPANKLIQLRPDYPDQLNKAQPEPKTNLVVWGSAVQSVFQ